MGEFFKGPSPEASDGKSEADEKDAWLRLRRMHTHEILPSKEVLNPGLANATDSSNATNDSSNTSQSDNTAQQQQSDDSTRASAQSDSSNAQSLRDAERLREIRAELGRMAVDRHVSFLQSELQELPEQQTAQELGRMTVGRHVSFRQNELQEQQAEQKQKDG